MNLNIGQLIVWVVIGALAGTLASILFYRTRTRVSELSNIILGLLGALLGGALFSFLNINLGLPTLAFRVDDLVAAFVGSVILLLVIRYLRR
ncbi:MAG: GlsB/YeaQ/YmgE family stress response membrane protein [Anaerolineae bacterium]|nr:GlsB/YeaQ/YmgE family stress response membrane protein [Anaerolineae bacterium]